MIFKRAIFVAMPNEPLLVRFITGNLLKQCQLVSFISDSDCVLFTGTEQMSLRQNSLMLVFISPENPVLQDSNNLNWYHVSLEVYYILQFVRKGKFDLIWACWCQVGWKLHWCWQKFSYIPAIKWTLNWQYMLQLSPFIKDVLLNGNKTWTHVEHNWIELNVGQNVQVLHDVDPFCRCLLHFSLRML